jgi:hypothetical protein
MPDETPAAPEAVTDETVNPHDITTRGVFVASSAIHAVLPVAMVERCIENAGVTQDGEGLWLFEKTSRIDTENFVMRIRPRDASYFDERTPYARPDEFTNLKMVSRDLSNVVPFASDYARLARVYGWPQLLYVWTDEESIFIRRAFTEDVWAKMNANSIATQLYVLTHKHLFGLLPATR